jgi:hypothetical protein
MGDTGLFGDMRLIDEFYKPDLTMISIGGHLTPILSLVEGEGGASASGYLFLSLSEYDTASPAPASPWMP